VKEEHQVALVAATLGSVAALVGAAIGGATSYLLQRAQLHENRRTEARAKRAEAYTDYLAAADQLAGKSRLVFRACGRAAHCRARDAPPVKAGIYDFRKALYGVWAYGSGDAVKASIALQLAIPLVSGGGPFHKEAYDKALGRFLAVTCRDVNPEPDRAGC
jgi:hypothetical protein